MTDRDGKTIEVGTKIVHMTRSGDWYELVKGTVTEVIEKTERRWDYQLHQAVDVPRFELKYVDSRGRKRRAIVTHRTLAVDW